MHSNRIYQAFLVNPVRLPGGFFRARGPFGKFWLLAFLVVSGSVSKTRFCVQCLKNDFFKKGLKNECFPGFDGSNQKKSKLNQRQKGTFWSLFKIDWRRIWGVIGNKYAKRCLLTMPSLVTNARKGVF